FPALSERRQQDGEDVQTIIQVTAKLPASDHLDEIPIRCSYKPDITLCVRPLPKRSNSCSCNTRSNFGCSAEGISPTSSKNRVPLSAISKRPIFCAIAPVKAPFSCPKSSLSNRSSGIAAQFSFTNGRPHRALIL